MKVVVTGGAGYVGSVLVPELLAAGHEVKVVDTLVYGGDGMFGLFKSPKFTFVNADVRKPAVVKELVKDADVVLPLAALVGFPACKRDPETAERTNVGAIEMLSLALSPSQMVVFPSTGSCYGRVAGVCTEETPLSPLSVYGATKARAEAVMRGQNDAVALRFATAYGVSPRMRLDLLIHDFVYQAMRAGSLLVYEGGARRTFVHVGDMARSFLFAIEHYDLMKGQAYNVGSNDLNFTKAEIARKIADRVRFRLDFAEIGRDEDERDYEVSYEKIAALGFQTEIGIDAGIDEVIRAMPAVQVRNPYSNAS